MITCIGVGPGDIGFLTQKAASLIGAADVVAGFDAVVNVVGSIIPGRASVITMGYKDQTERLAEVARLHHQGAMCVVVFMGDIHFSGFQYLERVERACGHSVETLPGISSAQILASRGHVCFDETTFITFHRRGDIEPFKQHLLHVLQDGRNAIVIPRPWDFMPTDIAAYLIAEGAAPGHRAEVWENLTGSEAHWTGELCELAVLNKSQTLQQAGLSAGIARGIQAKPHTCETNSGAPCCTEVLKAAPGFLPDMPGHVAPAAVEHAARGPFSDMSILLIRALHQWPSQLEAADQK